MGDRATLLETGRFVQKHAEEGRDVVDAEETADAETEARHRSGAESGETASMSVLGALLLRRGDLDGAERWLRAATGEGTGPRPTTWAYCCTSAATRTRRPAGGASPLSRAPPPRPTRWAGTTGNAATSPLLSTGCASPPSRDTRWGRTPSRTCWSTAGTSARSGGCAPPPSRATGRPPTGWRARWTGPPRARPRRPRLSAGTGRPPREATGAPRCTSA